ncbi:molybdate transport system ATP-binding protein [Syntrophus gentianae]|uniref:Molybdate transport system ATP-binding protein n=1 Tax=Syntrophus gentianae TaxID=43775 RepID=A0A1H8AA73_9BACT|nr:molybdenum ABC transporter ATP-binding protein [Syntrophus gentianae]SEM67610.1 molybdate transport system ATP-binding protein [Syntrophus gentianae]
MELRIDIEKQFGAFSLGADCTVEGDRIGLFGPSGSGKSTLVGLVAGLHKPDRGTILIDGEALFDSGKGINIPVEKRRIGMVFQLPHLFPHLNVKKNLLYGYKRCAPDHRKIALESVVEVLQIGHLLNRGVRNLSGGERQRVSIGRAILSNPRLLIMDEPLSGLDDSLKYSIIPFLKSVSETFRIPYLFISHSLIEMRIMTDRVLNVADGHIAGQMTAEELARTRMGESEAGYTNLLKLRFSHRLNGLQVYICGEVPLLVSGKSDLPEGLFELSSTDIILFKRHPEAISARNLLQCHVVDVFETGFRLGVELECGGERLIAEISRQAAEDLEIVTGIEIYAAIKASAFRRLG